MTAALPITEAAHPRYWATMHPLLQPGMLLHRGGNMNAPFPFNHPNVQYVHFARNAIYALVAHLGLVGADVLVPAYFHGVEVEALLAAGVVPRFYPVRAGMQVEPDDIVALVRPETRAVYLIHYLGFPGPAQALQDICRQRGLLLIEDCALALLSKVDGQPLGSFGDASVFCLYKTLPTPDGGAVVLREGRLQLQGMAPSRLGTVRETAVSLLRRFEIDGSRFQQGLARTLKAIGKSVAPPREATWVDVGTQRFSIADTRLLMSGISRIVIDGQDFEEIIAARRRNYLHLESLLQDLAPPLFSGLPEGVCPLFFAFVTRRKRELCSRLQASGIQAVLFWLPAAFSTPRGEFPEVDWLRETVLELPCQQDIAPEGIERIAHTVRAIVRDLGE